MKVDTTPNAGWSLSTFHQRASLWGWQRDSHWMLRPGEATHWHRCDVRWLCRTAGGTLEAEGPDVMFFRFIAQEGRHESHRRLFERGIHCLRFPKLVLAVCVPAVFPDCPDCGQVVYEGEEECPFDCPE